MNQQKMVINIFLLFPWDCPKVSIEAVSRGCMDFHVWPGCPHSLEWSTHTAALSLDGTCSHLYIYSVTSAFVLLKGLALQQEYGRWVECVLKGLEYSSYHPKNF